MAGNQHNLVFVVTEHDSVFAFDADTFAQLWKVTVLGSGETTSDNRGCDQVSPEIGITSTPVIDLNVGPHGTLFVVAMSKDNFGNCSRRVFRGGCWGDFPALLRSATRNWAPPPLWSPELEYRSGGVGFRVARTLD